MVPESVPWAGDVSTLNVNADASGSTPDNVTATGVPATVDAATGSAVGARFWVPSTRSTTVVVPAVTVVGFVAPLRPVRGGTAVMFHVAGPPVSLRGALPIV